MKESDGIKRALELCRKEAQTAGLKGVYFIAMIATANHYPLLKEAGFNGTGSYGYQWETVFNRLSPKEQEVIQKEYSPRHTPYKYLVKTIPDVRKERLETCPAPPFMVFIRQDTMTGRDVLTIRSLPLAEIRNFSAKLAKRLPNSAGNMESACNRFALTISVNWSFI